MKIEIKKLDERAIIPTYGTPCSAGADLYALLDGAVTVGAGETVLIKTGIAIKIPDGYVGLIYPRSSMAVKRDLAPANKVGVIDSDYRGEIMVALFNHGKLPRTVENGERIAQIVFTPCVQGEFALTDTLDDTLRGAGGFGSTGK